MRLTKRVDAVEAALAKQNGDTGYKTVVRADGESDNKARKRAGLADWPGVIIFLSETDLKI